MLVLHAPQVVADWVAAQYGAHAPTVDAAIGYYDGEMRAGVYFDGLTDNNIFAHIANRAPVLPKSLLAATARYVYKRLGLERMTFAVPEDNDRVVALVRGFGAEPEGRLLRACGTSDLLWFVLWRDAPFAVRMLDLAERGNGK